MHCSSFLGQKYYQAGKYFWENRKLQKTHPAILLIFTLYTYLAKVTGLEKLRLREKIYRVQIVQSVSLLYICAWNGHEYEPTKMFLTGLLY